MSIAEELVKELEENPKIARKFLEKIFEIYPELSLSIQMRTVLEEIRALKEEQTRLREDFKVETTKIWQEIRALKEEQTKIWHSIEELKREQTKIWQEIRALKEEQTRLREDFNRMLATIKDLQVQQRHLEERVDRMYEGLSASMMYAFGELSKFAGMTFEEFVRKFLSDRMRRSGEIPDGAELKQIVIDGEEIDLFLEDPLIVGEVTAYARSADEEMGKLLRKVRRVRDLYGKEPRRLLIVQTARKEVARRLKELASEENVELILGKEV